MIRTRRDKREPHGLWEGVARTCQSAGLCVARRELGAINAVRESVRQEQKDPPSQPGPLNQFGRTESSWVRLADQVNPSIQLFGRRCCYWWCHVFSRQSTNRRVMLMGLMFCTAFVLVSFFARPQPENDRVLVKADRLTLTAGKPPLAN
jgi:hypothetical protein